MPETFTIKTMWNGKQRDIKITNNGSLNVGNTDRTAVANALLDKKFHKTSLARTPPTGADVYLHCDHTNTLYALKQSDVHSDQDKAKSGTDLPVAISWKVLGIGEVNKGKHIFKHK